MGCGEDTQLWQADLPEQPLGLESMSSHSSASTEPASTSAWFLEPGSLSMPRFSVPE